MVEEYHSLCLALPNLTGTNTFYRIADYDPITRKFEQAQYLNTKNTPLQISSLPRHGVANQIEIRTWIPIEDSRQKSENKELRFGYIYEIIFLDEAIHQPLNNRQIQDMLYRGIKLPDGMSRYFLLVLDVTSNDYRTLLCDKEMFEERDGYYFIPEQVNDLSNITTTFDLINISNDEFISTSAMQDRLRWYNPDSPRYFYISTILPESTDKFEIRSAESYTLGFFAQHLMNEEKRMKYPVNIRVDLMNELQTIIEERDLINKFFKHYKDNFTGASEIFINNVLSLVRYVETMGIENQEIFLSILEESEYLSDKYEVRIESKWMNKYNQNILNKENELNKVRAEFKNLNTELSNLVNLYQQKEEKYTNLNLEINNLQKKKAKVAYEIEKELDEFNNSILKQYKYSLLGNNVLAAAAQNILILDYDMNHFDNMDEIVVSDIAQIIEVLQFNLSNFLIEVDASRAACLLLAILMNNKTLILPEFQSDNIANSLSLTLTGNPVKIISILDSGYNINKIIEEINQNETQFYLIKGKMDLFQENSVFTLINQSKYNNYLFSINDEKSMSLYSTNIWNYCVYSNFSDYFNIAEDFAWKKTNLKWLDFLDYKVQSEQISQNFERIFMSEPILNKYAQEELLYTIEDFVFLYKLVINPNYVLNSIKDTFLSYQICIANIDNIEKKENYFNKIGVDHEVINRYK